MADPLSSLFQPTLEASWTDLQYIAADQLGLPTTDWGTYAPERNILIINARMLEALGVASIERWRGMFLGYAAGESLTILSEQTYQSPRLPATYASCEGEFVNTSLTTYTVDAGDYVTVKASTRDDVRYKIDGPLSIPPGTTDGFLAVATTAGSIGNAIVGEIDEVEGSSFSGVTFNNTSAAVGRDEESDADLAPRARLAITALAIGGPSDAYEYFAKGGERNGEIDTDVAAIGVNRVRISEDLATGKVTAYYASASGAVSGTATTGDLGTINAKILKRVVPLGTDYEGLSAADATIDVDYSAYLDEDWGGDADELKTIVDARITDYIASTRIGGVPETTPTPGYTGELDWGAFAALIRDTVYNGATPIIKAIGSVNGQPQQLLQEDEVPIPGAITSEYLLLPPQSP